MDVSIVRGRRGGRVRDVNLSEVTNETIRVRKEPE
jgi:hypothetical protein